MHLGMVSAFAERLGRKSSVFENGVKVFIVVASTLQVFFGGSRDATRHATKQFKK